MGGFFSKIKEIYDNFMYAIDVVIAAMFPVYGIGRVAISSDEKASDNKVLLFLASVCFIFSFYLSLTMNRLFQIAGEPTSNMMIWAKAFTAGFFGILYIAYYFLPQFGIREETNQLEIMLAQSGIKVAFLNNFSNDKIEELGVNYTKSQNPEMYPEQMYPQQMYPQQTYPEQNYPQQQTYPQQ